MMRKFVLGLLSVLGLSAFAGAGFYQALYSGASATTGDPFTDGVVVGEMGLAKTGNSYTVGETTYKIGDNTTAAYKAYWKMTAGVKYSFVKNFDDWGYVYITSPSGVGTAVMNDGNWGGIVYKTYTPTETGYHLIDVRVGQGGGGIGPNKAPFNSTLSGMIWSDDASITGWNEAQANLYHCFANEDPTNPVFLTSKMDATATLAYAPATKTATISVTVKALTGSSAGLSLVTKNPDSSVVTNEIAAAATVSATPYTKVVTVADGSTAFVVLLDCGDDGISEYELPGIYAGEVTIVAGENGDINFGKGGTFVVSRGETAADTAYPLTVNYAVTGGSAIAGTDFEIPSGAVTIPAGASTATITIAPAYNKESTEAATLTLGLADGNYTIGAASSAEISFAKANGCWTYDATAKTLTDGVWTFVATVSGTSLTITTYTSMTEGTTELNLAWPILGTDGTTYRLVEIGNNLFNNSADVKAALEALYLPQTIVTIGQNAFRDCTKLSTLSPLIPDSITMVKDCGFYGCPITGDFRAAYGTGALVTFQGHAFYGHKLSTVTLGPRMKETGYNTFCSPNNTTLTTVVLPDTLQVLGQSTFGSCSKVESFTPCLPHGLTRMNSSAADGFPLLTGTLEFCCGDYAYDAKQSVASNSGFDTVVFGEKFTGQFRDNYGFSSMPNLRHFYFKCGAPLVFNSCFAPFQGRKRYQLIVHVPEGDASWETVMSDTTQVTPWAQVSEEAKAKFAEYFPSERKPRGLIIAEWNTNVQYKGREFSLADSWITDDSVDASISVVGDPANIGTPSIPYGTSKFSTLEKPYACTMPEYVETETILYKTTGYTVNYLDENGDVAQTETKSGTSFELQDSSTSVSFIWHFEAVGYRAEIKMAEAEGRTITEISAPTFRGYYQAGDQMSYQVSGTGFVRWYGDVAKEEIASHTVTVTAGPGIVLMPYFTSGWTESEDGTHLSNGYWSIKISKSGSDITLTSASPSACSVLDLSTGVGGGDRIVKIDAAVFKNMTTLERLVLPETLTHIGANAFQGCTSLRQVEPLLPDSVVNVESAAFDGCPLEGHFRAGYGEAGNMTLGAYSFQGHQLSTIDIGPRMTFISWYVFQSNNNKTLTDVRLPDYVQLDAGPFGGCVALTNLTPCLPSMKNTCHTMLTGLKGLTGTLTISCTQDFSIPSNFAKDSGFREIVFGEKFTGEFPQWDAFSGMPNLRNIYFTNDNLPNFKDVRSFRGRNRYGLIVHVPLLEDSPNWCAAAADANQIQLWSDVPAEAKEKFAEYFPGVKHPKGLIKAAWSSTNKTSEDDTLINAWITWPGEPGLHIIIR